MQGIFFGVRFAALTQLFTVCGLAHTVLSKTSKAALLSFSWTGTAPTVHAIWSAERDISSAGYASAYGRQQVAFALQPAALLGWVTWWGRRMAGWSGRWLVDSMRYASLRCHYLFGRAAWRRTSPSRGIWYCRSTVMQCIPPDLYVDPQLQGVGARTALLFLCMARKEAPTTSLSTHRCLGLQCRPLVTQALGPVKTN